MRFGILLPASHPQILAEQARLSEEVDFELIAVGDSPLVFRELYVSLSVMASQTRRARLTPLVTNAVTRHPAVTASAIATVDELSRGRAILGLGTGDSALFSLGKKATRLQDFEAALRLLHQLLAGEEVFYEGRSIRLGWIRRRVPIWITAEGPKALQLAGRVADGVVVGTGLLPEIIVESLHWLQIGAEQGGRTLQELDVWFFARANFGENTRQAMEGIKTGLAASAKRVFRFGLEQKQFPRELLPALQKLQQRYDYSGHMVPGHPVNSRLTDELGLSEYLARRFAILGTQAECLAQLQAIQAAGASQILLSGNLPDPADFIRTWGHAVIATYEPPGDE